MLSAARLPIAVIAVFAASSLAGYFALGLIFPKAEKPKPSFVKVAGFWDKEVFNVVKKQFQEKNPEITIEYERKDPKRYFANLKADLSTKNGPDVFWWHSSWGPLLRKELASLPTEVFKESNYEETFYPITKKDLKIDGTYRGFPLEFDGLALLYNKRILSSANLPFRPETWNILNQEYVGPLTKRSGKRILNSAIALGSIVNVENYPEIIGLLLLQNGASFTKNGQLIFHNKANNSGGNLASEAIDFFFRFSKTDRTWDNTLPNSIDAFARGQTAMIILPAAKIHNVLAKVRAENLSLDFGVERLPQLPTSETVTWGSYWAVGVSDKSNQKTAAWKLTKFLLEPTTLRTVFELEAARNDFGRAYPRVEMAKEQTTHPYLAAYLVQAQTAQSWYLHSDTFDGVFNDALIKEWAKVLDDIEKGAETGNNLERLAEKLNPILKKHGVVKTDLPNNK